MVLKILTTNKKIETCDCVDKDVPTQSAWTRLQKFFLQLATPNNMYSYDNKRLQTDAIACFKVFESQRGSKQKAARKLLIRRTIRRMNPSTCEDLKLVGRCRSYSNMDITQSKTQNPYHNANHIVDVLRRVTSFCQHYTNVNDQVLLPNVLAKETAQLLQVSSLLHDLGHRGHSSQKWTPIEKKEMRKKLRGISSTDLYSKDKDSESRPCSLDSRKDSNSLSGGDFVNLLELLNHDEVDEYISNSEDRKMSRMPTSQAVIDSVPYNEAHHIISIFRYWSEIQDAFASLNSTSHMEMIADIILQTDISTYDDFVMNFKPTTYHAVVTFMKLADLGHFLEDSFEMHLFWVFRIHHEMGTFDKDSWTLSSIAKDTLWFGQKCLEPILKIAVENFLKVDFGNKLLSNYRRNMESWRKFV